MPAKPPSEEQDPSRLPRPPHRRSRAASLSVKEPSAHDEGIDVVAQKLDSLPQTPGCYLFIDKAGAVVYVGKAKSLRARVRSYFQDGSTDARYFIPILRRIVRDLETVVTTTEKEAAVLENQLIKQHQPRFNVKLRDDKDFLCLRIDTGKDWPRLETVRRPSHDGARYSAPTTRPPARGAPCTWSTSTSSCAPAPTPTWPRASAPACSTRSAAARRRACSRSTAPGTARRCARWRSSSRAGTTSSPASSSST
ncbi:MAG: GIY-YIG nuclease family protein [Polyangiaceae bacterium]